MNAVHVVVVVRLQVIRHWSSAVLSAGNGGDSSAVPGCGGGLLLLLLTPPEPLRRQAAAAEEEEEVDQRLRRRVAQTTASFTFRPTLQLLVSVVGIVGGHQPPPISRIIGVVRQPLANEGVPQAEAKDERDEGGKEEDHHQGEAAVEDGRLEASGPQAGHGDDGGREEAAGGGEDGDQQTGRGLLQRLCCATLKNKKLD